MFADLWKCTQFLYRLYQLFYNETDNNIQKVKLTAHECGAIGNKFLQFLMMHDGILSSTSKERFGNVFEDCVVHDWEATRQIYMANTGRLIETDFEVTKESIVPIGSGSIGQVYRLYNKELNTYVAFKVKHPNVDRDAIRFIRNVTFVIRILKSVYTFPFAVLLEEFLTNIQLQLDYANEAKNTIKLREFFANEKHLVFPEVYTYTKDTIMMSYHEGISFHELKDLRMCALVSCDVYLFLISSLINFDFVHSDLHYGNWKIAMEPNGSYKIIIYDCGIVGQTNDAKTNKSVVLASFAGDYIGIAKALVTNLEEERNGEQLLEYADKLMRTKYPKSSDRFVDFLKKTLCMGVKINMHTLCSIQGLMICVHVIAISFDKLTQFIPKSTRSKSVVILYLITLLERLGKYSILRDKFVEWVQQEPTMEDDMNEWLEDTFGHTDKDMVINIILKHHLGIPITDA
jgi:predicted unusual protein kinase regulating ubiquinone biosynthesis (AarF/ABC1/UbiB family)